MTLQVIHADIRSLDYCNRGARSWFARHGLDWATFIQQGLPAGAFLATGDAMARAVVQRARQRILEEERKHGRQ